MRRQLAPPLAAGMAAALAPRRVVLAAFCVGLPTPLLELRDAAAFAAGPGAFAFHAAQETVHGD